MQTLAPYSRALLRLAEGWETGLLRDKKEFFSPFLESKRAVLQTTTLSIFIKIHHHQRLVHSPLTSCHRIVRRLHDGALEDEGGIGRLGWAVRGSSSDCRAGSARSNSGRHSPLLLNVSSSIPTLLQKNSQAVWHEHLHNYKIRKRSFKWGRVSSCPNNLKKKGQ